MFVSFVIAHTPANIAALKASVRAWTQGREYESNVREAVESFGGEAASFEPFRMDRYCPAGFRGYDSHFEASTDSVEFRVCSGSYTSRWFHLSSMRMSFLFSENFTDVRIDEEIIRIAMKMEDWGLDREGPEAYLGATALRLLQEQVANGGSNKITIFTKEPRPWDTIEPWVSMGADYPDEDPHADDERLGTFDVTYMTNEPAPPC